MIAVVVINVVNRGILLAIALLVVVVEVVVVAEVVLAVDMAVMVATVVEMADTVVRLELLYSLIAMQILSILPDWLAGGGGSLCLKCFKFRAHGPSSDDVCERVVSTFLQNVINVLIGIVFVAADGCYNCGEPGHIARNCPAMRNTNNGNNGGGRSCYTCGEEGHLSRDCPHGGSKDRVQCYRCRGFGHLSRDCTQAGDGPMCYKCKGYGHIASQCTA